MKKLLSVSVLLAFVGVSAFAGGLGFRLSGGAGMIMGGDLNKSLDDFNAGLGSGLTKVGLMKTGLNFGAEFLYELNPSLAVGLGTGYVTASQDGRTTSGSIFWGYDAAISAIPVTLNLHYLVPLGPALRLRLYAGPGLYLSTVKYDLNYNLAIVGVESTFKSDMQAVFGAQGGLGLEFDVAPNVALGLDVAGRWLDVAGPTGKYDATGWVLWWDVDTHNTSTIWGYEDNDGSTQLTPSTDRPTGTGYNNLRKAKFSLSGVNAQLGIKFRF